jgi:hypothetical protein
MRGCLQVYLPVNNSRRFADFQTWHITMSGLVRPCKSFFWLRRRIAPDGNWEEMPEYRCFYGLDRLRGRNKKPRLKIKINGYISRKTQARRSDNQETGGLMRKMQWLTAAILIGTISGAPQFAAAMGESSPTPPQTSQPSGLNRPQGCGPIQRA